MNPMMLLMALAPMLGGLFSGAQQAGAQGASTEEQKRQFDILQGNRQRGLQETAPMRDKLMYMLQTRMGLPQQQFKPHDIFNPSYGSGPAQMGGYDVDAYNKGISGYQTGMGGVNQHPWNPGSGQPNNPQPPVTGGMPDGQPAWGGGDPPPNPGSNDGNGHDPSGGDPEHQDPNYGREQDQYGLAAPLGVPPKKKLGGRWNI